MIVVEIGGNDILGGTPAKQFERDLDQLLSVLAVQENRQVLMFELPLPPFYNAYGRV